MGKRYINGKDFMIFKKTGEAYKALAAAKDLKVTLSVETSETSSKDSGGWSDEEIKKLSWTANTTNLVTVDQVDYDALFDATVAGERVPVRFGVAKNASNSAVPAEGWTPPDKGYEGEALITSLELSGANGESGTYTAQFKGVGELKKFTQPK